MTLSDGDLARRVTRYETMKRALIIFTAVVVTACLGVLSFQTVQNSQRGKENRATLQTIRDCTQPTGKCYQRGQERTADAVSAINRVIVLAAACSANLPPMSVEDRRNRIQACVIDHLAVPDPKR